MTAAIPAPNTGPIKFVAAGLGVAAGTASALGIRHQLASPEDAAKVREQGTRIIDEDAAAIKLAALPFAGAAGITLGLAKRSPTAGFTTATTIGLGAVLTGTITAYAKADSKDGKDQAVAVGAIGTAATAGALFAVRDEFANVHRIRMGSIGMFGVAAGLMGPMMFESGRDLVGEVATSRAHR